MVTVLHLRQSAGAGGGADMVLRDQLRGLAGRDSLALAIAYLHKPGHDVSALTAPLADAGLSVHCLAGSAWADRGQVKALSRLIRETGTSVLHSHDPKSDVLAWWLRRRHPGLKLVATLHGWTARGWKGRLYEAIDKRILKSFDVTLAVSSATAARAARGGPRNSRLLANAIDADFWSAGEDSWVAPAGRLPVIFVGRMSAEKNPLGALEVAALCPALQVTLVGDGPLLDDVREQVAKRGLDERVIVTGALARDDIRALYRRHSALLMTSRTEGLPLTALEAMACGLPVFATRVGGLGDLVVEGQCGHLVEAGDMTALAAHLVRLAESPTTLAALAEMGRSARARIVANYSLARAVQSLEALYLSLAGGGR